MYNGSIEADNLDFCYICNINRTKSQNLNEFRLVLQWHLPNLLKPCVKSRMKI